MTRWRWTLIILILVALVLWGIVLSLNIRPELMQAASYPLSPFQEPGRLGEPLSALPGWAASVGLLITLYLAGVANLYLFPLRVKNMVRALTVSWSRFWQMALLGFGFLLLLVGFGLGAVLARITFPLTILAAFALFTFSVWGYLSLAYTFGRILLLRAGWLQSSALTALALGLLLLLPLSRIPFIGALFTLLFLSLGLGVVIASRFGSNEPWNLTSLLEEDKE
jgi:hypothetical protein